MAHPPTSPRKPGLPATGPHIVPTLEQQRILDRIAVQRERVRSRRAAHAQAAQLRAQAREEGSAPGDPDAPWSARLLWFARQHPIAVVVAAGVAVAAGPSRIIRWVGVLMPLMMKMRR
ncbi:hypothetical protein M5C99_11530 [Acidovorax sp. NCPPB 2350]|nr:hypothetical protein M5C99_11530 [Acidovorax sp. NCPPB 2350]